MTDSRTLTVGTHNLADRAKAQPLADIMGFNEIKVDLLEPLRKAGHKIDRAPSGSLAVSWDPKVIKPDNPKRPVEWHKAHDGQARLTPDRRTGVLDFTHRATGAKGRALIAHFINGTEKHKPPMPHRQNLWNRHAAQVERLTRGGREQGRDVVLLADTNVHRVDHPALSPLRDMQRGERTYDHVMHVGEWVLRQATRLKAKRGGSDHAPVVAHLRIDVPEKEPEVTYKRLPANLPDLLRKEGLKVIEMPGWRGRGRPSSTGGFNPVGVLWHHTGSYDSLTDAQNDLDYAKWLFLTGRPDLPAPLCQLSISAEGVVYVGADGRANHAGTARPSGSVAAGDGNSLYVGVECMNSGKQGWPPSQYDAMVKTGTVLGRMLGSSVEAQRGHRETSVNGKWDPGMLDLDKFRAAIKARLNAPDADDKAAPRQKRRDTRLGKALTPAVRAARRADRTKLSNRLKSIRARVLGRKG